MSRVARALIDAHECSMDPVRRRTLGAHYTPHDLARRLVEAALGDLDHLPQVVCDPTCGAGSFLLAAADALVARGVDPVEVVDHRLIGADVDAESVGVAREALIRWAEDRGADAVGLNPRVAVADTLREAPQDWRGSWSGPIGLVVGNPPFLNQLSAGTARDAADRRAVSDRFGPVGSYTDTSALFLLVGLDLVDDGGIVALLQPQSLLAARDARAVRLQALERGTLVSLWATDDAPFAASVDVCVPMLRRVDGLRSTDRHGVEPEGATVTLRWGPDLAVAGTARVPDDSSWGPLLAGLVGIPSVPVGSGNRLGSVATATAGFRDEFYAIAAATLDEGDRGYSADGPRVVTVGMIEPLALSWGVRRSALAGRRVVSPRVDLESLSRTAPRVGKWVRQRLRPKVLVATQTKVVEAVADPDGDCVPVTPTISVEPVDATIDAWLIAAALSAPPVAARAVAVHFGSGLSSAALRWSARSVLDVTLPTDEALWRRGAQICREIGGVSGEQRRELLVALGRTMTAAHGLDEDHPVLDWWTTRALSA